MSLITRRHLALLLACALALFATACDDADDGNTGPADATTSDAGDTTAPDTAADTSDTSEPPDLTDLDDSTAPDDASDLTDDTADASDLADAQDADDVADLNDLHDATDGDMTTEAVPLPGFGTITGLCGIIDDELFDAQPSYFVNTIDFAMDGYDDGDFGLLTAGGQEIITDGNAGGSSIMSEVFAYEVLARCELAVLLKTETEVVYDTQSKITDLLVEIDGHKVGVSVTRAVGFPFEDPYTVEQARNLLEGKLSDIQLSSESVSAQDAWVKQILHVIAYAPMHADSLAAAFDMIDPAIKADTILWVTISEGDDAFIY